jgi:hypothetical protein
VATRIPRRRLLIGIGVLGALGSVATAVRTSGYDLPEGVRPVALDAWEWLVVRALARRICAPDRAGVVTPDQANVVGFVDAYAAKMPRRMRRDLGRFLGVIEHVAPLGIASATRFSALEPGDQDRVLAKLEQSESGLFRGGFEGVKALLFMGYYRDARTWSILGYTGPLVGPRPTGTGGGAGTESGGGTSP